MYDLTLRGSFVILTIGVPAMDPKDKLASSVAFYLGTFAKEHALYMGQTRPMIQCGIFKGTLQRPRTFPGLDVDRTGAK